MRDAIGSQGTGIQRWPHASLQQPPIVQRKEASCAISESFLRRLKQRRHIAVLLFVANLAYMPVVSACLRAFACTSPIAGVRYLIGDLRQPCAGSTYTATVIVAGLTLAVFGIGYPAAIFFYMSGTKPTTLTDPIFQAAWGFLYAGYRTAPPTHPEGSSTLTPGAAKPPGLSRGSRGEAPPPALTQQQRRVCPCISTYLKARFASVVWWESTVLVRKAGIVLIANLMSDPLDQIVSVNFWVVIFALLHFRAIPYKNPLFNWIEGFSLATVIFTAGMCNLATGPADTSLRAFSSTIVMLLFNMICMAVLIYALAIKFVIPIARKVAENMRKKAAARGLFFRRGSATAVGVKGLPQSQTADLGNSRLECGGAISGGFAATTGMPPLPRRNSFSPISNNSANAAATSASKRNSLVISPSLLPPLSTDTKGVGEEVEVVNPLNTSVRNLPG